MMDTKKLLETIPKYLDYLSSIGYCEFIMNANKSVINKLKEYCLNNDIKNIDSEVIERFYIDILKINDLKGTYKYVVKRAINGLFDYINKGKTELLYRKRNEEKLNCYNYEKLLDDYINNFIIKMDINENSKKRKIRTIIRFLNYLTDSNINDISLVTEENVIDYLYFIDNKFSKKTSNTYIGIIKEFTKYLYRNNLNNHYIIQNLTVVDKGRKPTPEYFNKYELQQIIDSIDIKKTNGKFHYVIILLLITYGLRIKDIMSLKFENIDFEKNAINIIQSKTKKELVLFLTERVKFAILDYIKNERPKDVNSQYIFITIHRPYRPYIFCNFAISSIIVKIIKNSKVNIENKTLGSRIFRHSLATNMINDNIQLNNIQSILGHTTSKTTAKYITRDINNLELLTLDVLNNE